MLDLWADSPNFPTEQVQGTDEQQYSTGNRFPGSTGVVRSADGWSHSMVIPMDEGAANQI